MAWGQVLSGISSVLGAGAGIAKMFGGEEDNYHPEVWRNQRTHDFMRSIRDVRAAAAEYGFHPLALLGAGAGSGGFAQPVGGEAGRSSLAGDVMSGAANAFADIGSLYEQDDDRMERERQRLDVLDAQARERYDRRIADIENNRLKQLEEQRMRADIDRINAETFMISAQTRSQLNQMRQGALGAVSMTPSQPTEVVLPYTGTWALKPGTNSASDVQNMLGEPAEWQAAIENYIWNLLHDPDSKAKVRIGGPGGLPPIITRGPNPN